MMDFQAITYYRMYTLQLLCHNMQKKTVSEYTWEAYLHEYGHYDQSIGAFSSFCVICVQLMIVVYQLNLEHKERT